ncbi:helicase-related protein [Parvularcula oceani]|uniref:helicase-related protein n=1 Tax=Parvularcula oceani TaxID=1247963 RepID=UPI00068BFDF1|nr:helicase-related protein [Parvularcula oceani]
MTERMTDGLGPLIDNLDGNTHDAALHAALGGRGADGPSALAVATGFFTPAGLVRLVPRLEGCGRVRLLLGSEAPADLDAAVPRPGETHAMMAKRLLGESVLRDEARARAARDAYPFGSEARTQLTRLIALLRSGRVEARRYTDRFLHAKAYLFGGPGEEGAGVMVGSSNLTRAGLTTNLEASLVRTDDHAVRDAHAWFDGLWNEAEPYDLAGFLEALIGAYEPFDVYVRMLLAAYGDDLEAEAEETSGGLSLMEFQMHGVARARRIMRELGGVMVADEVGLGKTFIGGEIMRPYHQRRQRTLLLCPAALRRNWEKFIKDHSFDISADVLSYEQLANERQLGLGPGTHLTHDIDDYQLVVIDEAHNYRNPASRTRAGVLRQLLRGARKREVLLLTATPVNNSIWDLHEAITSFVRQDAGLAEQGVRSLRAAFRSAAAESPSDLSPDRLFPIIDATCVKRTRAFVKRHYKDERFIGPDGTEQQLSFPRATPKTVRYEVDGPLPALFDAVEAALDPQRSRAEQVLFARYHTAAYRLSGEDDEEAAQAQAAIGLLRSGLLKRFESSAHAFRRTLTKMVREHDTFLAALAEGHVVGTQFLRDWQGAADEEDLSDVLGNNDLSEPASAYDTDSLRRDVEGDRAKLQGLLDAAGAVTPETDDKLLALVARLRDIAAEAEAGAKDPTQARRDRKVLVFSYFSDTVAYIRDFLAEQAETHSLGDYVGRIASVSGDGEGDVTKARATEGFTPRTAGSPGAEDLYDLLITTDVLAEGVNLQDCRHVVNFDVPWNPMRLVQRHGRVDRIGSPHDEVFLTTIFPAERLDRLLRLEQRILDKIAAAARTIGVRAPVEDGEDGDQSFTQTRSEIEKLLAEDPSLYERGGAGGAAQSGEEYRQALRGALGDRPAYYRNLPAGIGSGFAKGDRQGVVFCAEIADEVFFRFIPTSADWAPISTESGGERPFKMDDELAVGLRLAECAPETTRVVDEALELEKVFSLWEACRDDIVAAWNYETDPRNVQPRIDKLNRDVAALLRKHESNIADETTVNQAIRIAESPWSPREKNQLRPFYAQAAACGDVGPLVTFILTSGVEPYEQPKLKDPVHSENVTLIAWQAITSVNTIGVETVS